MRKFEYNYKLNATIETSDDGLKIWETTQSGSDVCRDPTEKEIEQLTKRK